MTRLPQIAILAAALAAGSAAACSNSSTVADSGVLHVGVGDVGDQDGDAVSSFRARDMGADDAGDPRLQLWGEHPVRCAIVDGPVTYPEPGVAFTIPDQPSGKPGDPHSKEDILRDFGGTPPRRAAYIAAADEMHAGRNSKSMFARRGQPVRFFYAGLSNYEQPKGPDTYMSITMLQDYEPVDAEYILWNDDLSEAQDRQVGTGAFFHHDEDIELVEIRIPASSFPQDRYYEMGLAVKSGKYGLTLDDDNVRFSLFYAGLHRNSHPCFHDPGPLHSLTDLQRALLPPNDLTLHAGVVYPADLTDPSMIEEAIEVPAGSTVDFVITSRDVVHGFHIDETRVNGMVLPGQITRLSHTFEEPGEHLIVCHEYCGVGHQNMYATLEVEPRDEVDDDGDREERDDEADGADDEGEDGMDAGGEAS